MRLSLRRKARRGIWDDRFLNGHPKVNASLHPVIMRAVAFGLDVTSTRDGVHAPKSFHYEGRAVDFGSNRGFRPWTLQKLLRFQRREHTRHGKGYSELFGPSNYANRKWGRKIVLPEGSAIETLHDNHVHIAI